MIWARYSSSAATICTGPVRDELDRDLRPQRALALDELLDDPVEEHRPRRRRSPRRARCGPWPRGSRSSAGAAPPPRRRSRAARSASPGRAARRAPSRSCVAAVDRGDRRPQLVRQDAEEAVADLVGLVAPRDVARRPRPGTGGRRARTCSGRSRPGSACRRCAGRSSPSGTPAARRSVVGVSSLCSATRSPRSHARSSRSTVAAEQLAGLARRPGDAALLVEGEDRRSGRLRAGRGSGPRSPGHASTPRPSRAASPSPMSISSRSTAWAVSEPRSARSARSSPDEQRPAVDLGDEPLACVDRPGRTVELDASSRPGLGSAPAGARSVSGSPDRRRAAPRATRAGSRPRRAPRISRAVRARSVQRLARAHLVWAGATRFRTSWNEAARLMRRRNQRRRHEGAEVADRRERGRAVRVTRGRSVDAAPGAPRHRGQPGDEDRRRRTAPSRRPRRPCAGGRRRTGAGWLERQPCRCRDLDGEEVRRRRRRRRPAAGSAVAIGQQDDRLPRRDGAEDRDPHLAPPTPAGSGRSRRTTRYGWAKRIATRTGRASGVRPAEAC